MAYRTPKPGERPGAWPPPLSWERPSAYDEHGTPCYATEDWLRARHGAPEPSRPAPRASSPRGFLTLAEAGAVARAAPETIRYWIWEGRLTAYKPGRAVLVKEEELLRFIEQRETRKIRAARGRRAA